MTRSISENHYSQVWMEKLKCDVTHNIGLNYAIQLNDYNEVTLSLEHLMLEKISFDKDNVLPRMAI